MTPRLWGKLRKSESGEIEDWLPLADHCTDVASVFESLCRRNAVGRSLQRAAGRPLSDIDVARLSVLAFLHDVGKCNHGFQAKALTDPPRTAGHVRELTALVRDPALQPRFLLAIKYSEMQGWFDDPEGALRMLLASVSHHGKPVELDDTEIHLQRSLWLEENRIDPLSDIADLMERACHVFPDAFVDGAPKLSAAPALQHRFAGLVMLSDWLGSHAEEFFPFRHGEGSRIEFSRAAADRAVKTVGIDPEATRRNLGSLRTFSELFSFQPRSLQKVLFDETDSPLLIAESETGSGKTEAALGHFYRLFARGKVDSIYFALPTRVAATQLYERVLTFAQNAFGSGHPPVVLALPGYAYVDGEDVKQRLPDTSVLWQEDPRVRCRERAWSAERPKRFLAAPIAVGTVDQALLSVIQTNHAHLRAVCLERSLLVVDEVHASDVYMRGLLRALLEHHRAAGGTALLLSATLGSAARAELVTPLREQPSIPSLEDARAIAYPSVTDATGQSSAVAAGPVGNKRVRFEPVECLTDPATLLPRLAEATRQGGRVLVVLNTVARVIELIRAAETNPDLARALFRVGGIACPHHGRFARPDRLLLDRAVGSQLGKGSEQKPVLLVGSQTLEQSLDIDADWLVTDLCPMDVLLQRIGRLHRHDRARPPGFEDPRCTVLVPEDATLGSFFTQRGDVRGEAGLGKVYPDLRVARLTLERIGEGCEIDIPADNRSLVEWATHPDNLARFESGPWVRHRDELAAIAMAHGQTAQSALIREDLMFGDPDLRFRALGKKLGTRLGLDDRRIPLAEPVRSPFGQMLYDLSVPGWMAKGVDAPELDGPLEADGNTLRFRYGGKSYRYTRYGLEFDDERESAS